MLSVTDWISQTWVVAAAVLAAVLLIGLVVNTWTDLFDRWSPTKAKPSLHPPEVGGGEERTVRSDNIDVALVRQRDIDGKACYEIRIRNVAGIAAKQVMVSVTGKPNDEEELLSQGGAGDIYHGSEVRQRLLLTKLPSERYYTVTVDCVARLADGTFERRKRTLMVA